MLSSKALKRCIAMKYWKRPIGLMDGGGSSGSSPKSSGSLFSGSLSRDSWARESLLSGGSAADAPSGRHFRMAGGTHPLGAGGGGAGAGGGSQLMRSSARVVKSAGGFYERLTVEQMPNGAKL